MIGIVILGSIDQKPSIDSVIDRLADAQKPASRPTRRGGASRGLNWAIPKSDRLQVASGALSARYTIHEQANVRRDNRQFIEVRRYMRIVARLSPTAQKNGDVIPPFNPLNLFAAKADGGASGKQDGGTSGNGRVNVRVIELLGGILPNSDGRELDAQSVSDIVKQSYTPVEQPPAENPLETTGQLPTGLTPTYLSTGALGFGAVEQIESNITVLKKTVVEEQEADDPGDAGEVRIVSIAKGDNISRILQRLGAPDWLAGAMIEASRKIISLNSVVPGQQLHVRMVPSITEPGKMEPAGFTLFGAGHSHQVTVKRDSAGEFKASAQIDRDDLLRSLERGNGDAGLKNVYDGVYDAGLTQNLDSERIMDIMRLHAYETDYRKRIRNGDQIEWFFELRTDKNNKQEIGELLYTTIRVGNDVSQFWRFRTADGHIDYYNDRGHNSKKFLVRKPVRGNTVRLTSGFGFRRHPVYKTRRMHTGVDFAGPRGTPILAAGKGVIEEARRRGTYGNYIRIRHANGYHTAYAHMRRFGRGIRKGVKVRQGQVIGYIGSTGVSSGPHLHYEVLVNQRFVNPLKIKVPRERRLQGPELAKYQRERQRIDELRKRPPVKHQGR